MSKDNTKSKAGLILGIIALICGVISIFALSLLFVPLAIITGAIGLILSIRAKYTNGIILSSIALVCAVIGTATSPILLAILGAAFAF